MLTLDDAYSLVEAEFTEFGSDADPVIVKDATQEFPWGWVVFYQSRRFLETSEIRHAFTGNAPYIVNKRSGDIEVTGTAQPVEVYIRKYESRIAES